MCAIVYRLSSLVLACRRSLSSSSSIATINFGNYFEKMNAQHENFVLLSGNFTLQIPKN